jgi:uncharacterized protein (TIGR03083 family)
VPDTQSWIDALQSSHDRFVQLVRPLTEAQVKQPAYPEEWSIADTASHLGSQSEIMGLYLDAGLTGGAAPSSDDFHPIWDRWNALPPAEQASGSIASTETFVTRMAQTSPTERERFSVELFGADAGLGDLAAARLAEHAVHTWDIAVALDPGATVSADAAALLVDRLPGTVRFAGRAVEGVEGVEPVVIRTTDPERIFRLTLGTEVALEPTDDPGPDPLELPAEALLRLVYGRLDAEHTPAGVTDSRLAALRQAFPGL